MNPKAEAPPMLTPLALIGRSSFAYKK